MIVKHGRLFDHEELQDWEPEDSPDELLRAPFPWFGGKSRIARKVWQRFGDVQNYIEPFFGSGACLLNRPQPFGGAETVNDADGLVCNFWRALQKEPEAVAEYADWPVIENDLHARHLWLVGRKDSLQEMLEADPNYYDTKAAGWWVWGMACWIGSEFCSGKGPWQVAEVDGVRQLVHLSGQGRGVKRQLVHLSGQGHGVNRWLEKGLCAWMDALAERLSRVRVCCGDWKRVCGGKSGDALHHFFAAGNPCGVFLDPPYADTAERASDIYRIDCQQVAHEVREWALRHGNDRRLRIALCGYEGEHNMPPSWECVSWKAHGGMALTSKKDSKGKLNAFRERVWFSPYCL